MIEITAKKSHCGRAWTVKFQPWVLPSMPHRRRWQNQNTRDYANCERMGGGGGTWATFHWTAQQVQLRHAAPVTHPLHRRNAVVKWAVLRVMLVLRLLARQTILHWCKMYHQAGSRVVDNYGNRLTWCHRTYFIATLRWTCSFVSQVSIGGAHMLKKTRKTFSARIYLLFCSYLFPPVNQISRLKTVTAAIIWNNK